MLKHYEGEHCMNWRRTEGHDKTVSECFPCLWPEINYSFIFNGMVNDVIGGHVTSKFCANFVQIFFIFIKEYQTALFC